MDTSDSVTVAKGHDVTDAMNSSNEGENRQEERAAQTIQRYYRGYRTRRELKGWSLSSSTRWIEVVKEAQWHQAMRNQYDDETNNAVKSDEKDRDDIIQHDEQDRGGEEEEEEEEDVNRDTSQGALSPEVRRKWKLAGQIALRAGGDDNLQDKIVEQEEKKVSEERSESGTRTQTQTQQRVHTFQETANTRHHREPLIPTNTAAEVEKKAKMMDLQYFLEMVDTKHRYGSNLRAYHSIWKNSPSKQNFFYWLDYGEGKDVEIERVPRDRLEREQVRYLSREERQDYLVVVDKSGRFRWAKNGERVWTDSERFKDSIRGVVPVEDKTPTFREYTKEGDEVVSESTDEDEDEDESDEEDSDEEIQRYMNPDFDNAKGIKKIEYVSPAVIFNHLMQKSLKKRDKWIFVADTSFRIYIGIKESGAFQHSSFLRGARIAAAGLVKIKDGQLRSLSPLSGHYRPPAANFRAFVHALQNNGVDMSRVSISRSYAVLVGIEGYMKFKQKKKDVKDKIDEEKAKVANKQDGNKPDENEVPDVSRSRPTQKKTTTTTTSSTTTTPTTTTTNQSETGLAKNGKKTGFFSTITRKLTSRGSTQESETVAIRGRGIPGTGPEEGVPAPEGRR